MPALHKMQSAFRVALLEGANEPLSDWIETDGIGAADRIAVLGSEPEVLFYADRPSATGYIYMYSLTERQPLAAGMQQELIQDVTATRPLYVVLVEH